MIKIDKKTAPVHIPSIILSGGGNDIQKILIDKALAGVFERKTVAYVAIAAETNSELLTLITNGFPDLKKLFLSLGAVNTSLITSVQFDDIYRYNIIVLSGGDTAHLLKILRDNNFLENINKHPNIQLLIGISAGAIALSREGIGTLGGEQYKYQGLGLVNNTVVPHSNPKLKSQYPDALHLREYEFYKSN